MKIAISAHGADLDAMINPRFGRSDYFLIVDTETNQVDAYPNENMNASGGAGIQSASFVLSKGVQAILTGSVGPKAGDVFSGSGVQLVTGQSGTVREAVEQFKAGGQATAGAASEKGPAPSGPGTGMGMGGGGCGRGGGRGMGGGGGRGMCGGGGQRRF